MWRRIFGAADTDATADAIGAADADATALADVLAAGASPVLSHAVTATVATVATATTANERDRAMLMGRLLQPGFSGARCYFDQRFGTADVWAATLLHASLRVGEKWPIFACLKG
jgi:hypothetical protein